jgi:hypothetical protein
MAGWAHFNIRHASNSKLTAEILGVHKSTSPKRSRLPIISLTQQQPLLRRMEIGWFHLAPTLNLETLHRTLGGPDADYP